MDEISLSDIDIYDIGNEIQIAGVIWTGKGKSFVTQFPGRNEDFSQLAKMPLTLEDWERLLRQTDLLETEIFATDPTGIVKKIVRKTARQIDSFMQWEVFARDNYACRYCGRNRIPLTVDHVDLWEQGGATIVENLISACKNCNKERGSMPYDAWLASPEYKRRSSNLPESVKQANEAVLLTLDNLKQKRVNNIRSR